MDTVVSETRICERQVHRANASTSSSEEYYRVSTYIPSLNDLIVQLETRFTKHEQTVLKLSKLVPGLPSFGQIKSDKWLEEALEQYTFSHCESAPVQLR